MHLSPRRALFTAVLLAGCGQGTTGNGVAAVAAPNATAAPVSSAPVANVAAPVAPATPADDKATQDARNFSRQMTILLVGRGTIDGKPITGVRAIDKCHTGFATAEGETLVDWTKAGNLAAHIGNGREMNDVPGPDGTHQLSVPQGDFPEPAGNVANRTTGAFGLLALDCGG